MLYDEIVDEIGNIVNSNFSMDKFKELGIIRNEIEENYRKELSENKAWAKNRYYAMIELIYNISFDKLKEKLDFDDEVINKIIPLMSFVDQLEDIYVLDGIVIAKIHTENDKSRLSLVANSEFIDITSPMFLDNSNPEFKNFMIKSLNNSIYPLLSNKIETDELLEIDNDDVKYNLANLNIFANRTLDSLVNDDKEIKITKFLITYEDKLFYFDMKIRNDFIILAQNDFKINVISEMLNKKVKVKKN